MARVEKTVFISYRRKDISWALAVYQYLTNHDYDVFFDYSSIPSGDFEQIIISNIRARAHFVLILTPDALNRTSNKGDWLRREIETAIDEKRNIIPLFFDGFNFGSPDVREKLTGKMGDINRYNGLDIPSGYFPEAMERLRARYLNVPLEAVIHPVSTEVRKKVKKEKVAANKALREKISEIKELVKPVQGNIDRQKQPSIENESDSSIAINRSKRVRLGKTLYGNVSSWFNEINLRKFVISVGVLLIGTLGIFTVRSLLLQNAVSRNSESLTPAGTITTEITPTSSSALLSTATTPPESSTLDPTAVPVEPSPSTYEVIAGDTCFGIAVKLDVSLEKILDSNEQLDCDALFVGQKLQIPTIQITASATPPPTPKLGIGSTMTGLDGMTLLYVPAGDFTMGSEEGDSNERPVHTVNLDAFWVDQTEVTNSMYADFLNDIILQVSVKSGEFVELDNKTIYDLICNGCPNWIDRISWGGTNFSVNTPYQNHPVVNVSWYGANEYCSWANRRLPTEAEWEKSARGPSANTYPWGEILECGYANYYFCVGNTTVVGEYLDDQSEYGVYDMAGNVKEWVGSLYQAYPYVAEDGRENLSANGKRIKRGTSWRSSSFYTRSASRFAEEPEGYGMDLGFRCAMDPE